MLDLLHLLHPASFTLHLPFLGDQGAVPATEMDHMHLEASKRYIPSEIRCFMAIPERDIVVEGKGEERKEGRREGSW